MESRAWYSAGVQQFLVSFPHMKAQVAVPPKNASALNAFSVQCLLSLPLLQLSYIPTLDFYHLWKKYSVTHTCPHITQDSNYYDSLVYPRILINSFYDKNKKISQYKLLLKLYYVYMKWKYQTPWVENYIKSYLLLLLSDVKYLCNRTNKQMTTEDLFR